MPVYPLRCLPLIALLLLAACKPEGPTEASRAPTPSASATASEPPLAPQDLPATWPSGDAITLALPPAAGASSLTKALYERGDIVLEQVWPDGTRERWWHATDGSTTHLGRDGSERVEAAP